MYIYTLLTVTVKVFETFLEAMQWKPFQLIHHILNISIITKAPSLICSYQSREQVKINCSHVRRVWGCSSVVTMFFTEKFSTKTIRYTGALSWRRNQLLVPHFSRNFLLTASLRRRKVSMYISSLKIANPVDYTDEFWEIFQTTTCK